MRYLPRIKPRISVLVPIYNNEEYLEECLGSLAGQTLTGLEIILINDGSTNEQSIRIMERFRDNSKNVKLLNKANSGYGHSLNVGIREGSGEYVGIVESDDFIHPRMYEALYKIAKNNGLDVIKSDLGYFVDYRHRRLFSRGRIHKVPADYNRVLRVDKRPDLFKSLSLNQTGIYKKSFLTRHAIRFNESPGASFQDNGFFFQIFMATEKIYLYDQPLYFLRRDNERSSVNDRGKWGAIFGEYAFIEKKIEERGEKGISYYPAFIWKKYNSYFFNLRRVADSAKELFLERFAQEFNQHRDKGQLDLSFFTEAEKADLEEIMADPASFLKANAERLQPKKYLERKKREADLAVGNTEVPLSAEKIFRIPDSGLPRLSILSRLSSLLGRIAFAKN